MTSNASTVQNHNTNYTTTIHLACQQQERQNTPVNAWPFLVFGMVGAMCRNHHSTASSGSNTGVTSWDSNWAMHAMRSKWINCWSCELQKRRSRAMFTSATWWISQTNNTKIMSVLSRAWQRVYHLSDPRTLQEEHIWNPDSITSPAHRQWSHQIARTLFTTMQAYSLLRCVDNYEDVLQDSICCMFQHGVISCDEKQYITKHTLSHP